MNPMEMQRLQTALSQSGCPEDLLADYLDFLQNGGQQVEIVRNNITQVFQKEALCRKRRHETMEGTVTFRNKEQHGTGNSDTGVFIGIEFIRCCFTHGIPARMLKVVREHGEVVEIVVGFGVKSMCL